MPHASPARWCRRRARLLSCFLAWLLRSRGDAVVRRGVWTTSSSRRAQLGRLQQLLNELRRGARIWRRSWRTQGLASLSKPRLVERAAAPARLRLPVTPRRARRACESTRPSAGISLAPSVVGPAEPLRSLSLLHSQELESARSMQAAARLAMLAGGGRQRRYARCVREGSAALARVKQALCAGERCVCCLRALWIKHSRAEQLLSWLTVCGQIPLAHLHGRCVLRRALKHGRVSFTLICTMSYSPICNTAHTHTHIYMRPLPPAASPSFSIGRASLSLTPPRARTSAACP